MSNISDPFVSVIIPVFNDNQRLKTCLEALENQTYPKNLYEVIVIDNGSDESIKKVVETFGQTFATYESQPGSYAARNKGISIAKGEIIAFTDSDCIPTQNWLETGVNHLLSIPNCGLVAGKIEIFFKNPNRPTAVELYDSVTFLQQKRYVEQEKYGATANLFTTEKILKQVGVFDSKLKSGGDVEWGRRVYSYGYSLFYADDSKVLHPARSSLEQLYKKVARRSGGIYQLNQLNKDNTSIPLLIKLLVNMLSSLRPPLRSAVHKSYFNKNLKDNEQKIKVFTIAMIVHYFDSFERIRVQLGGTPKR
ncbi:glycosyltransferase [Gloeocapsopsis crepidinum LEGE 06123]|uniref:Glycosyltransferase n=1 Tax=Gloeocapsopsis crepidinum LEGE 06123 TaxID=588587 RepID=A0ABR9UQZ0_9CHRO|nr:glycosyltransferase [Gloeocapsopsis crepidinum]MBE9190691.1 glycosyltransferase [Gloeocapsopsis crepidinum LEGE 06123]